MNSNFSMKIERQQNLEMKENLTINEWGYTFIQNYIIYGAFWRSSN